MDDPNRAFAGAVEALEPSIRGSGAEVSCDPLPEVRGAEAQIAQVLQNLIGNSLKFCEGTKPRIHVSAENGGDMTTLRVADNGVGIPPAKADEVFDVFNRLEPDQFDGCGIGLAVSKRIVEHYGGTIWVEPKQPPGATISFSLPADPR